MNKIGLFFLFLKFFKSICHKSVETPVSLNEETVSTEITMTQVPKQQITKAIFSHVRKDLEPDEFVIAIKTGLAVFIGGFFSLLICGQFGLGITSFAQNNYHAFHHNTGTLVCAVICGGLFAIIPCIILRFLCSPMQFRVIIRRKWQAPAIWLVSCGSLLAYHGDFGNEYLSLIGWAIAAFLVYQILGLIMDQMNYYHHIFYNHN